MTSLAESEGAGRARHYCALERRLFEVVGGWVPSVPEPEVKLLLRRHSFEHASHAGLWAALLPVGEDEGSVADTLRQEVREVLDAMAGPAGTTERLLAMYGGVLPRLVESYGRVSKGLREASDGPLRRVLDRIVSDETASCAEADALVSGVLGVAPGSASASDQVRRVVSSLDAVGGLDYIRKH